MLNRIPGAREDDKKRKKQHKGASLSKDCVETVVTGVDFFPTTIIGLSNVYIEQLKVTCTLTDEHWAFQRKIVEDTPKAINISGRQDSD